MKKTNKSSKNLSSFLFIGQNICNNILKENVCSENMFDTRRIIVCGVQKEK